MVLDGNASRWPVWFAPAGFLIALGLTLVLGGLVTGVAVAAGADSGAPALTLMATVIQDVVLLATALVLARRVARPQFRDFGLRPAPWRKAVAYTALALVALYAFSAVYAALLDPEGEQDTLVRFGADRNTAYLVVSALMVIVIAPVVEEVFFRGFMYRSLRNRLSPVVAGLVIGAIFGAIHYSGPDTLELLPVLALLGAAFCWLYEATGSLYPAIAVHVVNNSLAFAAAADAALAPWLAAGFGATMLTACVAVPRRAS